MEVQNRVPDAVARRLPSYYRNLCDLEEQGIRRISSQALGKHMGLTASQIRQDINYFGGFGQQGYGYHVPNLRECIAQIIGLDRTHQMIIVGAGNIGSAIAYYTGFQNKSFALRAIFDSDAQKVGKHIRDIPVLAAQELEAYLQENAVDILVLTTPAKYAKDIVEIAARGHVRAIWNFTPVDVTADQAMEVSNVHLSDSLMALTFRLHEREVHSQKDLTWVHED